MSNKEWQAAIEEAEEAAIPMKAIAKAYQDELDRTKAQRDALAEACRAQQRIIDAQTALLVAYRAGKRPSEKTLTEVSKRTDVQAQTEVALATLEDS